MPVCFAGSPQIAEPTHLLRRREVRFHDDHVELVDRVSSDRDTLDPASVFMVLDGPIRLDDGRRPDVDRRICLEGLVEGSGELTIHKELRLEGGRATVRIV